MKYPVVTSDPFFNWSENERKICNLFEKKTNCSRQTIISIIELSRTRILNRKIQTLWQTTLQMHSRKRAWTKILSFHQPARQASKNEVYSPKRQGSFSKLYSKFSECQEIIRRNQRNQHRTTPTQITIKNPYENSLQSIYSSDLDCEHVARLLKIGGEL